MDASQLADDELKTASLLLIFTASDTFHEAVCASVDRVLFLSSDGINARGSMGEKCGKSEEFVKFATAQWEPRGSVAQLESREERRGWGLVEFGTPPKA